jgi:uncharacterized protein DUF3810
MPWRPTLVAAALGAAFVRLPPALVERVYSTHLYARIQPLLTSLSNLLPFALFDLLSLTLAVLWIGLAARDLVRVNGRLRAFALIVWRTMVWSAALYLAFLVAWGLNYRRVRLVDALAVDTARVTPPVVKEAAILAAGKLNALHPGAHAAGWLNAGTIDQGLAEALERAVAEVGRAHAVVPPRPKPSIFDWYFRRAAVEGMTDPFFLEVLVSSGLLPFERPFVVAHEWSHIAGIADEGEANFVGWLSCLRASPPAQYSGWLFLYGELLRASSSVDRPAIAAALEAGPRADLNAIRDRVARQVNPRLSVAGWRVYDSYLKANRVEAGAASYDEVVRLALGARLASGWRPLAR